jgi:phage antirepressor YoqD-like protein
MTDRYTLAELLSVAAAAEQLGIKERRMQVLIREHGLGRRIGRDWVLTPADVERVRTRPSAGRPVRTASEP